MTTHPSPLRPSSRLRVRAFGALRVERDGVELGAAGKSPRKLLELLALLVAQGGRPLPVGLVIDTLWPSLDADAPRASMDMALARLRKLLGAPGAVCLIDGQLSLDPQQVWTDVAAFEALAAVADDGDEDAGLQAIALYRDALLGSVPVAGRLLARRQQLAQRFGLLVQDVAGALAQRGRHSQACRLYQQALLSDPASEPLHRALMAAQIAQGECAEALRSYQRCRTQLHALLGVPPAAATHALAQQARHGDAGLAQPPPQVEATDWARALLRSWETGPDRLAIRCTAALPQPQP